MKRLSTISLMLILILSLFSCVGPTVPVSSIILNSETLSLTEGDEFKLTATVSPSNATDKAVVWSSSDATIASVKDGLVSAVKAGKATITVTSLNGGAKASCTVTVSAKTIAVQSVTLDQTKVEMTVGESLALTATVKPDDATDKTVTWKSSDANIASVDQSGKVTAIGEGSATITAKAGDKETTCSVTVKKPVVPVESVTLDQESVTLEEGQTITLTATVKPDNATDKTVTWESSDTDVATVNNGVVSAVSAGTATIKAKAGDKEALCVVTVSVPFIPVESVTLNYTSLPMGKGQTFTLTATVKPDNATDKTVTWESSDTAVATVDQNGTVKSIGGGSATITAKAGDKTATCIVTVTVLVEYISLDKTSATLDIGDTITLSAIISPADATDGTVVWSSSNEEIAMVDQNGKVTAINVGSTTIIAAVNDKTALCTITVQNKIYASKYLTFTSEGQTTLYLYNQGGNVPELYYSFDNLRWKQWDYSPLILTKDTPLYICGDNLSGFSQSPSTYSSFHSYGDPFSVEGDIMSLIDRENDILEIPCRYCFTLLFSGCNNLKRAPALSALTLTPYCYDHMFLGCTSLITAPELPATTLANWCYSTMFYGCTSLINPPELPATSLAEWCYYFMFSGCTSLSSTPELPAIVLANSCYSNMFRNCINIVRAPNLPARSLVTGCYNAMFLNCKKLSYVYCLALDNNSFDTNNWLDGVSSIGTFVKAKDRNEWPIGPSGIPEGWTVFDAE